MFDWNILAALGGTSLIGLVLLAMFAPGVVIVATEWLKSLSPLIKGISEGIVYVVKGAWEGLKDILDNVSTIVFVVVLSLGLYTYGLMAAKPDCEACIKELRKEYRFVPRTPAEKKAYQNKIDPPEWYEFWRK